MNPVVLILLTLTSVGAGSGLCFWLVHKAGDAPGSAWIIEHILCPIIRILVLLFVVSLVYPAIDTQTGSVEFWQRLGHQQQFNDLINILFIAGLLLAFVPI